MNHKFKSILAGEISTASDMQMIPLMTESEEELKSFLMSLKEESEKAGLKFKNEILYGKPQIHVFLLFLMSYHRCVIKLKHFTGKKNSTLKKLRSWHPIPSLYGK